MWKRRAVTLCGCVAVLPLVIGCSTGVSAPPQAYAPDPAYKAPQAYPPTEAYAPAPAYAPSAVYSAPSPAGAAPPDSGGVQVYAVGPVAPAAIVVMLPGAGDVVTTSPQLWAAQGFDVVTPPPAEVYRMAADEERAMARLIASAEAMADAPIWLVGPSQVIESALPQAGTRISGVVVTSAGSPTYSCSESFFYHDRGTGAPPQVKVTKSGDCGATAPATTGREPSVMPPAAPGPNHPRIIEASAAGKHLPPGAQVRRLAQLIKAAPPS